MLTDDVFLSKLVINIINIKNTQGNVLNYFYFEIMEIKKRFL